MVAFNLDSQSGSALSIASEATVATYTAAGDGWISGRLLLSSLNGAAATLTIKVQLLNSSSVKLGVPIAFSVAKDAAADTVFAACWGPVRVLSGQKLTVRASSSNASDTSVSWTSLMDDASMANVGAIAGTAQTASDVGANASDAAGAAVAANAKCGTLLTNAENIQAKTDLIATNAADSPNAVTAQGSIASKLDAAVSSRMATYTQPTGFLAATFPASIASPTNITAGTIGSVTGNVGGNVVGSVGSVTGLNASNLDAAVSSRMATFAVPANFAALLITSGGAIAQVSALAGNTPQSGDAFARLGAPAGASVSADIAAVAQRTALITSGKIVARSSVLDNGQYLIIVRGDDYNVASGQAMEWTDTGGVWPDLTDAAVTLTVREKDSQGSGAAVVMTKVGSVITPSGDTKLVRIEPLNVDTSALTPGNRTCRFDVQATLATGERVTLILGDCTVIEDETTT